MAPGRILPNVTIPSSPLRTSKTPKTPFSPFSPFRRNADSIAAVWKWNEDLPSTIDECAHHLIQKQARSRPEALAVDAHDGKLTYGELDALSDRIAHYIVSLGVQPEDVVPLCFEKSAWAIVGILGVIKSGAAMVHLDPQHPQSRRNYITSIVEAKIILCSQKQAHLFESSSPPSFVVSKDTLEALPQQDSPPTTTVTPSNLLYIIFTSGSTGTPKGCLIEHQQFCSGSIRHAQKASILPSSRVLQLAAYTFDVSMLEILTSLIHGACICTPDMALLANGPAYIIQEYRITWTFMTPSLVKLMAPSMVPTLKTLALGGEPLAKIDVETWAGHVQLINGYGPSECSVAATGNTQMTPDTDPANIGHPVGGICWIVDADDHDVLLPPGTVGELLIEGPILARGYFKNKEKTDEVFIERPAWGPTTRSGANRRFYKTGDLAKFLWDGSIYFVGRKDTQVKLRGLRIELGEIEHHIVSHPSVRHQMVILPKSGLFADRLVALVSLKDYLSESSEQVESEVHLLPNMYDEKVQQQLESVRKNLGANVPEYMVPETWVVLQRFPLLTSGKLNRAMISKWILEADNDTYREIVGLDFEEIDDEEEASSTEEQLREICSIVLNIPKENVSLSKSFLSLGGDSISAMQIMAKCRAAGLAVTVKDILRSKSITELSYCVKTAGETAYSTEEKFDVPFDLSPVQRMYFDLVPAEFDETGETRFNQSFFLKAERPISQEDLSKALEQVVGQHSMLRARFLRDKFGKWMQVIPSQVAGSFAFSAHAIKSQEDAAPVMTATQQSMNEREGPVFAVALFNTSSGAQLLYLVAHHVMIDLVSWRVILRDLEEVLTVGSLSAPKPLPFQNWLALQSEHESQPKDLYTVLPFDIPPPDFDYWGMSDQPNRIGDTKEQIIRFDASVTKELLEGSCHAAFSTEPIDLLLASLVYSFYRTFNDRPTPALFREGHGREPWNDEIDISGTVGWFTTMYPLFIDMNKGFSMIDVIKRAKDVRNIVPGNGRPYFATRYLNQAGIEKFHDHDHVELSFDYLGLYQQMERADALLTQVPGYQAIFEDVGKNTPRFALVEITAEVIKGQMQLLFVYNTKMSKQDKLESWMKQCESCLIDSVGRLQDRTPELTLSDFPLMRLSYDDLDDLTRTKLPAIGIASSEEVESVYPSTPMQHGLLISQVRPSAHGAYEYSHIVKVSTRNPADLLDVKAFSNAWDKVVQRHTSLRTVFIESVSQAGLYDQVVLKQYSPDFRIHECSESEVGKIFDSQEKLVFKVGGHLHRFTICRVSRNTAIFKFEINHAIIDGSSIANIVGDLTMAYDNRISDKPGFAFEEYIKHVLSRPLSLSIDFWRGYLADVTPCMFPLLAPFEDASDPRRRLETVSVDVGMYPAELIDFCSEKNVTLVNIFQLAWGLVLRKYSGSDDVCFGYLSSGRDVPLNGIEDGVGAFITMLVSRLVLSETTRLSIALDKVADDLTQTLPNQHIGLAEIHHALRLGSAPLFNTIISFHKETDQDVLSDSTIKVEPLQGYDPTEYALSLDVGVTENKINVTLQYWTSDYTRAQAQNIGATYAKAIESIITDPKMTVGETDLVSAEHVKQLQSFTATNWLPTEECIHDAVEAQAMAIPEAEAICSYEGNWTYQEVDDQSTRLAHHLVSLGVKHEVIVPYCFQKSAWAIISMLAILKAGGTAVALDPSHPIGRLEGLIEQTESRIILAARRNVEKFEDTPNLEHVVGIDRDFIDNLKSRVGRACTTVKPSDMAFIVFTSGTTGKPKGIMLEHSNLRTCATAMGPVLGFGPSTRALQFASYTFDVSLQDILTTLQFGGTICVISDEERMNDLAAGINARRANWADMTATVWGLLKPADVPTMQRVHNGGEPLNRDVVQTWADHVELYNLYGPAETTVNQTASKRLSKTSAATNIGPAFGTHVWITNEHDHNRLVPIGCIGEILIEGPLLARGYLKDPIKTATAFIENPDWVSLFPSSPSPRRFYKSGDLGLLNTDGSITIVGRRDTQVKINGQRVELDEIMYQTQLLLPATYQAVIDAIAIEEHTKSKTIIAYVAAPEFSKARQGVDQMRAPMTDDLRHILKTLQGNLAKVLPFYMIPSIFVPIFKIPFTASGKMDRARLRQMMSDIPKEDLAQYMLREASKSQPTNPMEQLFQNLFSSTLSIDASAIGRDDNFFALGGDSVGAMKMVAAARQQNVTLRVSDIFKHPTLSEIAVVAQREGQVTAQELGPFSLIQLSDASLDKAIVEAATQCNLLPEEVEDIYPTSALQEGLMALGMIKAGAYVAQKVFKIPSQDFDLSRFRSAWVKVVMKEAILRTRIVHVANAGNVQVVQKRPIAWREVHDLKSYLADDLATVFHYGDPLMRLAIVKEASGGAYFVWTAHHAIYDGWTVELLFRRVASVYQNESISNLTPFKNFIGRLCEMPEAAYVEFWKSQFTSQSTSYPVVPIGHVEGPKKTITHQASAVVTRLHITASTIKRAAWAMTLATYADSEDVIFASTLSGRNLPLEGIETIIGPTITTVPARVAVPKSGKTVRQFLDNVQNQATNAMEYEHFGLQKIRGVSQEAQASVDSITNLLVLQPPSTHDESFLNMETLPGSEENFGTYPLIILCDLGNDEHFNIEATYDEELISTTQMSRMLHQFEHFVQELSGDLDRPMEQLSLLNKADLKQMTAWHAELPEGVNARIPDLILKKIAERPDAPAICAWDGSLTYRELDQVTSTLANHLVSLGVGPEVKVGLCFDKSLWNAVSMFAVMRTGGVCVQLLPSYPMPRMISILDDIEAPLVMVSPQHAGHFDGIVSNILAVDQPLLDSLEPAKKSFDSTQYGPENAAFIVFTSGSTGKPKGVMIEHRGFCTMAKYQLPRILLNSESRVLQFATHTFDICLFESFAPLTVGACVCIPSEHERMNNLVGAINSLNVDWIIMVSTVADTFHPDEVPSVKSMILGGEPLRANIHARWAPRVNLFNDYGPAECSILAVMTRSHLDTPPSMIGKAQGCRAWVTDKDNHDRLVPIGCVGELLVEGPILARGYLKNPEKNAESYIAGPAWTSSIQPQPTRLYKTGDLVRFTEDGNMICLGRKDTQIKIRGLRVELGEIEHHCKTSSFGAQKLAVEKILLGGDVEKAALAAFLVPPTDDIEEEGVEVLSMTTKLDTKLQALKEHVAKSLPSYMVPTLFLPLRKLPETQTNKIDRNVLRRIGAGLTPEQIEKYSLGEEDEGASGRAPSSPTELKLQALWAQVLKIDPAIIGADDSFFKKGGDSIKAMRLTSMARSEGLKLIVSDIFKNPVLCEMAAVAVPEDEAVSDALTPFKLAPAKSSSDLEKLIEYAAGQCSVRKDQIEDIYPCTPLQEALMELATQQEGAYTAQRVFGIQGNVDVQRFKKAWEQLVARHPIFRTRIILSEGSGAVQIVLKEGVTWQNEGPLSEYLASDRAMSVRYGSPLARYALDSEHKHFIWTVHHALYDGYSTNRVMETLEALYHQAQVAPTTGYNEFIKFIQAVDAEKCREFWVKQQKQGVPSSFPTLPSATYQPSPDSEVTKTIDIKSGTERGYLLSTILRAAWAVVTGRYMSSNDVAFAATNSGRNAPVLGIDTIVGPTITTVPIQLHMEAGSSVEDFLSSVQQQATDMINYEHAGIQNISAMTGKKQTLRNLFVVQQSPQDAQQGTIINEVLDKDLLRGFHTYAVVVECIVMSNRQVHVELQFDHKTLPQASAQRVLDQFEHVLQQLNTVPLSTTLKEVELVTQKDLKQVVAWNKLVDLNTIDDCVHYIFRQQVKSRPHSQAVCSWDGELTYQQLDQLSGQVASHLVKKGVKPEYLVPLCFDKSMYTIIAMMGVLKAGGACCHLGRTQPIARKMQIISETGTGIVVTDKLHADEFKDLVETIVIDEDLLSSLPAVQQLPEVSPTNPAFVLFTSGSTGKPKGIVVEHGSLCTSSRAHGTNRKVGPETRLLQFAAYTFDVSVADIFTTLQRGGCICIPSEEERVNDLPGAINRMNVNYGFLTPTVAGMLDPKTVPTLKTLIMGGELLTKDNVRIWAPIVRLIISYGMAECSIHDVDAVPLTLESDPANLGRPSGCLMWIVDPEDHNKLAPIGAVGELMIEGRMVSRGYLNDKAKTDAAFFMDPTWAKAQNAGANRRMYLTGDLVRYSAEGEICYVSRKDFQVKHHGQRIELSEIEHHLVADPRVKHAVTLLPKSGYLQKRLVTVLSLESLALPLSPETELALVAGLDKGVSDVQIASVRNKLATIVPDYMVPAIWVVVRALPLTPNGKMDRVTTGRWLEDLDQHAYESITGGAEDGGSSAAPATPEQKQIHDMLVEVLGLPSLNMNRSFLDLGGDSITAMKLRTKCLALGITLTVHDIIMCESISHLVMAAKFADQKDGFGEVVDQAFPFTAWQHACFEASKDSLETPSHTALLHLSTPTTVPELTRAIEGVVQQHSMLRARFERSPDGQSSQLITRDLSGSYQFDAQSLPNKSDMQPILSKIAANLDPEHGPLMAVRLFNLTSGETVQQVIAIAVSPLVADIRSLSIITQDLKELLGGGITSSEKGKSFQSCLLHEKVLANGAEPNGIATNGINGHHQHTSLEMQSPDFEISRWGVSKPARLVQDVVEQSFTLPPKAASLLLGSSNNALSTRPADIVASILTHALTEVFGDKLSSSKYIKEDWRTARTVGQFMHIRRLPQTESQDFVRILEAIKDAGVRSDPSSDLTKAFPSCVEALFEYTEYSSEADLLTSDRSRLPNVPASVLNVDVTNVNATVKFTFRYSTHLTHQNSLARFVDVVEKNAPSLISTLATMERKITVSDFPLLELDAAKLAALENGLRKIDVPLSNIETIVPATALQQYMLSSQRRTPGSWQSDTAHKITTLNGNDVDVTLLQEAWKEVSARHEALRTVFIPSVSRRDGADQLVLKNYTPIVNVIECSDNTVETIIRDHATVDHSSFQPHVGFTVFKSLPSAMLYCKLEISHALQDGASTRIIYQDIVQAYQKLLPKGVAPAFREYVSWFDRQDMQSSYNFWDKYLSDSKPCLLPQITGGSRGEHALVPVKVDVSAADITRISAKHQVTAATLFQAVWILVLRAFTHSDDVLFGYLTAGRDVDIADVTDIVGPMINMLACRMHVNSTGSIAELLKATQSSYLETLPYQHGLVAALTRKEQQVGSFAFNSALSIEYASEDGAQGYYPTASEGGSPLTFDTVYGSRAPEFDMVLGVLIGERSLELQMGYWEGCMDKGVMERIVSMYKGIVEGWGRMEDLNGRVPGVEPNGTV